MPWEYYLTGRDSDYHILPVLPANLDCLHPPGGVDVTPHEKFMNNILRVYCLACQRHWELRSGTYTLMVRDGVPVA